MDEKYTPYNHKGTKVDGVEPKHRGTLLQKEACLISRYVLSLSFSDSKKNIKLWQAIISRFIKIW